jgi:hypothetical protein
MPLFANDGPRRVLAIIILRRHTLTNLNSRYNPRLSTIGSRDLICAGHHMIRRIGTPCRIGLREYDFRVVVLMGADDAAVSVLAFSIRVETFGFPCPWNNQKLELYLCSVSFSNILAPIYDTIESFKYSHCSYPPSVSLYLTALVISCRVIWLS